jgi:hypothetical protein
MSAGSGKTGREEEARNETGRECGGEELWMPLPAVCIGVKVWCEAEVAASAAATEALLEAWAEANRLCESGVPGLVAASRVRLESLLVHFSMHPRT